jgi:hypothetical protein
MVSMIFVLRKQLLKEISLSHTVPYNSKINNSLGIDISRGTYLVCITFCLWFGHFERNRVVSTDTKTGRHLAIIYTDMHDQGHASSK